MFWNRYFKKKPNVSWKKTNLSCKKNFWTKYIVLEPPKQIRKSEALFTRYISIWISNLFCQNSIVSCRMDSAMFTGQCLRWNDWRLGQGKVPFIVRVCVFWWNLTLKVWFFTAYICFKISKKISLVRQYPTDYSPKLNKWKTQEWSCKINTF